MTLVLDARPHVDAVKAVIVAAPGDTDDVYEYDEVPGGQDTDDATERAKALPDIYWLISLERRANLQVRASSRTTRTGWRLSVRCVGRTVSEARWAMAKAAQALNEVRLDVDGALTTRLQFESDQDPEPDDGRYSGRSVWTYAL